MNIPYEEKNKGDEEMKKNNYFEAIKHYAKSNMAIKMLYDDKSLTEEFLEINMREVGLPALLNMALCYMKREEWVQVIETTNKILQIDENNLKAIYRRCLAHINLENYENAKSDINSLKELLNDRIVIDELTALLKNKKVNNDKGETQIYKKMFRKIRECK